ncbi:MAG: hypothetical protein ACLQU5_00400, partial [Isosphaeraceae bacterium]
MANGKWQTACFDTIRAHDLWHPGICHLAFVIWHLSSGICHLAFVIWHLSSGICHLAFVIWHLS